MIEKVCHIGPALNVQGGISSVLVSYQKLFHLPDENFIASYNGSFIKSIPLLFKACLRLLISPQKQFELFQIHTSSYGSFFRKYLISLCLRTRGKKYIAHVHGSLFQKFCTTSPRLIQFLVKSYLLHSKAIVCITPDMQVFLNQYLGKSACRFFIIPNPCQTIAPRPIELEKHALPVKIIFSGRYGKRKGVYDLLKAFSLAQFNLPVELYLFGDGEESQVREQSNISPRAKHIHISGWVSHEEYLKRLPEFDFLVLPSYAETFGMSLVEGMGVGIPVLSTFSGGIPYVVKNGDCGFLVNAGDVEALAKRMADLANDSDLRIRMGKAGWIRAKENFSGEVVLQKLESAYRDLMA